MLTSASSINTRYLILVFKIIIKILSPQRYCKGLWYHRIRKSNNFLCGSIQHRWLPLFGRNIKKHHKRSRAFDLIISHKNGDGKNIVNKFDWKWRFIKRNLDPWTIFIISRALIIIKYGNISWKVDGPQIRPFEAETFRGKNTDYIKPGDVWVRWHKIPNEIWNISIDN